jgi:hypothetical protein
MRTGSTRKPAVPDLLATLLHPPAQYLQTVAGGCIAALLPAEDAARPLLRPLLRELLAACLLRPAMMYMTPPCINKLLLQVGGLGWAGWLVQLPLLQRAAVHRLECLLGLPPFIVPAPFSEYQGFYLSALLAPPCFRHSPTRAWRSMRLAQQLTVDSPAELQTRTTSGWWRGGSSSRSAHSAVQRRSGRICTIPSS